MKEGLLDVSSLAVADDKERAWKRRKAHVGMILVSFTFSIWNVLAKKTLGNGADPIIFAFFR